MNKPTISWRMVRRIWSKRQHKHLRKKLPPNKRLAQWIVGRMIDEILAEERS